MTVSIQGTSLRTLRGIIHCRFYDRDRWVALDVLPIACLASRPTRQRLAANLSLLLVFQFVSKARVGELKGAAVVVSEKHSHFGVGGTLEQFERVIDFGYITMNMKDRLIIIVDSLGLTVVVFVWRLVHSSLTEV